MAERHRPAVGQRLLHRRQPFRHEGGDLAHRHRDVVLDRGAFALLRLGMVFAQAPRRRGPAPRSGRAPRRARGPSPSPRRDRLPSSPQSPVSLAPARRAPGRRPFEQHVPVVPLGQRIGRAGNVLQHQVDALAAHQLAGGDVVLAGGMGAAQQRHRGLGRGHGDPRGRDVLGLGPELQHRLGDDARACPRRRDRGRAGRSRYCPS